MAELNIDLQPKTTKSGKGKNVTFYVHYEVGTEMAEKLAKAKAGCNLQNAFEQFVEQVIASL